jgi:uncharacterized protein YjbI with pentapeptide repeats
MLVFRRQYHREIATVLSDLDAAERRRVTELYTTAAEQLSSDTAPARLGALHALERLAQDNPAHRQAVVNVLCAYLRMPFSPTEPASKPEPGAGEGLKEPGTENEAASDWNGGTWQQERRVRLAAQRILAEHLRDDRTKGQPSTDPPDARFWNNIGLDLTGATLIDFNLVNGVMADANFRRAAFSRDASFSGAVFGGDARFSGAVFGGAARFGEATFSGDASFLEAAFRGDALFGEAAFSHGAGFRGATFAGNAWFGEAIFSGDARFDRAAFGGDASFGEAAFAGNAWFDKAIFSGDAWFDKAAFGRGAGFRRATFAGNAWFDKVAFGGDAWFDRAAFGGDGWFGEAAFGGDGWFGEAAFGGDAWFGEAAFGRGAWFGEAAFGRGAWFGEAAFGRGAWFGEAAFTGGADAVHFERARILSPGASHVWPTGWRPADVDGGRHAVLRANHDGGA